jgi:hypothetical protein
MVNEDITAISYLLNKANPDKLTKESIRVIWRSMSAEQKKLVMDIYKHLDEESKEQ